MGLFGRKREKYSPVEREKMGLKVVYHPGAIAIHDHARASAKKPLFIALFTNKLAREHIKSYLKYFKLN